MDGPASREDADASAFAFCTPAPSTAKRRRPSGRSGNLGTPAPRPEWAPAKNSNSRKDLSAFEKRTIRKVRDDLESMLKEDESPLHRNADWFRANPGGPLRKMVSQLCGVGQTAVSRCLSEASKSGGVLRSSAPGGRKKKDPMEIKMKDVAPDGESLYDVLQKRIAYIHKEGRANTRRNLLKFITEDPDGPGLPAVCPRVFRRKLAQMGFTHSRKRKLVVAERPKPYISRWRTSYCRRRVRRITGELPRRPRIWAQRISIRTLQIDLHGQPLHRIRQRGGGHQEGR